MPKIVIVGSTRFEPYTLLIAPHKLPNYSNDERSYQAAFQIDGGYKQSIEACDLVIIYAPDGIGEHTQKDIDYAHRCEKPVYVLVRDDLWRFLNG